MSISLPVQTTTSNVGGVIYPQTLSTGVSAIVDPRMNRYDAQIPYTPPFWQNRGISGNNGLLVTWIVFFVMLALLIAMWQWQQRKTQRQFTEMRIDLARRLDRDRLRSHLGLDDDSDSDSDDEE